MVRDAQKRPIAFHTVATVPMTTTGDQAGLLMAKFSLGETASKPIPSLMEIVDNGAEFWLRKGDLETFLRRDYENGVALSRCRNTLGLEVLKFRSTQEAKQHADTLVVAVWALAKSATRTRSTQATLRCTAPDHLGAA